MQIPLIEPDWPAPGHVIAFTTTRAGGVSAGAWQSFNLGDHVGDAPAAVAENRRRLYSLLPAQAQVQWLDQVHGTAVVAAGSRAKPAADACWTAAPDRVCAVLTADCLPVLLTDVDGSVVAAVHAGWRGLCSGVIEATVAAMPCRPSALLAWLGPAIGPAAFEVGPEVRAAFVDHAPAAASCFEPARRRGHFLADLFALAKQRLEDVGVTAVYGGGQCTHGDANRFFSYRRDGQTGRMATLIGLKVPA